jgi:hypothetical protein
MKLDFLFVKSWRNFVVCRLDSVRVVRDARPVICPCGIWTGAAAPRALRAALLPQAAMAAAGTTDARRRDMSAQTQFLDTDVFGAVPALVLFLALVLTALGVIAHAAFA